MDTKKQPLKRHREHIILFCANTPFKPKRVERKDLYKRQPKHKGQDNA